MFPILVTNLWWWLTQYLRNCSNARPQKRVRLSFPVLSKVFFELSDLTYITSDFNEFVTFFVDQQFTLWPGFCVLNFLSFFPQILSSCFLRRPPLIWHLLHNFKSTVKILSNFVAFLENMNLTSYQRNRFKNKLRNFAKLKFLKGKIDQSTNFDKSSSAKCFFV